MAATMDAADKNTTGLYGDRQEAPYDMVRSERSQLLSKMTFSPGYTSNTAKETVVLDYAENFRAQYTHLFPTRAPLLLSPLNECMRPKFISTFVRPTLLPYLELYDYRACARFLANYLAYDHLEDPETFPTRVMSPTTTLAWQIGNSVEISIVLASLLIGGGYDAYVVLGYAAREVVDNDQTSTPWPGKLPDEPYSDDDTDKVNTKLDTKFAEFLKRRPKLISEYDASGPRIGQPHPGAAAAHHGGDQTPNGGADGTDGEEAADPSERRLCHAWVVLLPRKRKMEEIKKPIFIEPSTGTVVPTDSPNYYGVEAIFNHQNYFVNMVPDAPPARLNYDLYDLTTWEHVFLSDPKLTDDTDGDGGQGDRARADEATADLGDAGDFLMDLPSSWVDQLTLNRAQYENRYPGREREWRYADGVRVRHFADYSDPELKVMQVITPDPDGPGDQVHTFYRHRKDELRRISVYPSAERSQEPREVHEWYHPGRKKDSRAEGLREVIEKPGVSLELRFYWRAREDGLASRKETFFNDKDPHPRKVEERYRGRTEDRLWYRSATYEQNKEQGSGMVSIMGGAGTGASGTATTGATGREEPQRPLAKMAEKFRRNAAVDASADTMKRTFVRPGQPNGEIWVKYHYAPDSITQASRQYLRISDKDRDLVGGATSASAGGAGGAGGDVPQWSCVTMPSEEPPREHVFREERKALIAAEKECLNEIRARTEETLDIYTNRNGGTGPVEQVLSVYDTLRNRPRETEADREKLRREKQRREASHKDYLAPYIAALDIDKSLAGDYMNITLSQEQAKLVRDNALKDLKERLIQRGHIMQNRMDREKEELNKRQIQYQKNLDSTEGGVQDTSDEFAKFLSQSTWRMKILDDRLTRHIEQASEKYAELAKRLAKDERLRAIYGGDASSK